MVKALVAAGGDLNIVDNVGIKKGDHIDQSRVCMDQQPFGMLLISVVHIDIHSLSFPHSTNSSILSTFMSWLRAGRQYGLMARLWH